MHIELTPLTKERLEQSLAGRPGQFKMFYDTEDCGCNGVLVIRIVSEPSPTDIVFQTEPFTFLCDRQQELLFDESMRLEAEEGYPAYKLTSDSTLFGSNIRVQDRRN
ncbi:iron-sulfur cluster biosynthesis family protein [Paenibacillus tritici]|uniref:iron-sulfur cluster biosynthesis family protein n=1 Tax=Paenibacillus tritici TaxID=1873425 RepID=UPI001BA5B7A6|nr:iron-sulfur cluster biosynthesis family protein [Paenibacillus tritici]QUL57843.1 iron-sulfur cluster biosynthesis family protein [Paenibacillus tritici]